MTKKQRLIDKLLGIPRYKLADELFRAAKYIRAHEGDRRSPALAGLSNLTKTIVQDYYWSDWDEFSDLKRTMLGYLFLREAVLSGDIDPCPDK